MKQVIFQCSLPLIKEELIGTHFIFIKICIYYDAFSMYASYIAKILFIQMLTVA